MTAARDLPSYDVVIPCYNRASFVADAVDSVLAQSHAPSRVILVDDASTDGTAATIRRLATDRARVEALILPRNGGVAAARNTGIAACALDWIAFVDDDDLWAPGAADALLGRATGGDVDVVVGYFSRMSEGMTGPPECGWSGDDIRAALRTGGVVGTSWSIVRRSAVEAVGGFDPTFRTCEDWDFFTRIAAIGARFGRIDDLVAYYRTVPGDRMIDDPALSGDEARVRAHPFLA